MAAVEDPADTRTLTRVVLRELRPRYAGLLPDDVPDDVVRDQVHRALRDLLGSINVEALPEMASRLVAVRLDQHLADTDPPPDQPPPIDHVG